MVFARVLRCLTCLVPAIAALNGCATAPALAPEAMKNYAVIIPREGSASAITELDGKRYMSFSGTAVNVSPGRHTFETTTCPSGSTAGCVPSTYTLTLTAGLAYQIKSRDLIEVYDRFHLDRPPIEHFYRVSGDFITEKERDARQLQMELAERDRQHMLRELRRPNLPKVRKVGAKICQNEGEFMRQGYVENMTDEKIQIRIVERYLMTKPPRRLPNVVASIIWDDPLNWDLCE